MKVCVSWLFYTDLYFLLGNNPTDTKNSKPRQICMVLLRTVHPHPHPPSPHTHFYPTNTLSSKLRTTMASMELLFTAQTVKILLLWRGGRAKWQMMFNATKCHVLPVTKKLNPLRGTYTLHQQPPSESYQRQVPWCSADWKPPLGKTCASGPQLQRQLRPVPLFNGTSKTIPYHCSAKDLSAQCLSMPPSCGTPIKSIFQFNLLKQSNNALPAGSSMTSTPQPAPQHLSPCCSFNPYRTGGLLARLP